MNSNMDYQKLMQEKVSSIEKILRESLPEENGYQAIIMNAMEYNLMAGGKRLRPMLIREFYDLVGGRSKAVDYFMAALEMIHTYSLIHDDLPAMDNDDYRRGRKTSHIVYGEDIAILAGDALLNYAFETACKAFSVCPEDAGRIGKALTVLANKAGIYGMIGGQVIDVKETGHAVSVEVLDTISRLKTGALIQAAMMIGSILGNASEKEIQLAELIGEEVGMAFQIQDDILDVISSDEVLGKPVHSDEKNEKSTYVSIYGIERSKELVKELSDRAIMHLHEFEGQNPYLEWLINKLVNRSY